MRLPIFGTIDVVMPLFTPVVSTATLQTNNTRLDLCCTTSWTCFNSRVVKMTSSEMYPRKYLRFYSPIIKLLPSLKRQIIPLVDKVLYYYLYIILEVQEQRKAPLWTVLFWRYHSIQSVYPRQAMVPYFIHLPSTTTRTSFQWWNRKCITPCSTRITSIGQQSCSSYIVRSTN